MVEAAGRHGYDRLAALESEGRNEWAGTYTHYHTEGHGSSSTPADT